MPRRPASLLSLALPLALLVSCPSRRHAAGPPSPSTPASRNVEVLAVFQPGNVTFNDVWGYVDPRGREYAIVGSTKGTFVLDCTDPVRPQQRGFFPHAVSGWSEHLQSDIKTYGHCAYVVTEGGGGMQILDLSDPDRPALVRTWGTSIWPRAHNLGIDVGRGVAYPCGDAGMSMVDLATDPHHPTLLASWTSSPVHDVTIQDGLAHVADIHAGRYHLVDVAGLPAFSTLATVPLPVCHSIWPSRDNTLAAVVSESQRPFGIVHLFDISDPRLPRPVSTWGIPGPSRAVHHAYFRDRVLHVAYNSDGYHVVDVSDAGNPVAVGEVPDIDARYCYPFMPSGTVYAVGRQGPSGLILLRPTAAAARFGGGTPGARGEVPEIHAHGSAWLGNARFRLELENAGPGRRFVLVVGDEGLQPAPGILPGALAGAALVSGTTDAAGRASLAIPIPAAPGSEGSVLHAQFLVEDPGAPAGFAATRGLRFELFAR